MRRQGSRTRERRLDRLVSLSGQSLRTRVREHGARDPVSERLIFAWPLNQARTPKGEGADDRSRRCSAHRSLSSAPRGTRRRNSALASRRLVVCGIPSHSSDSSRLGWLGNSGPIAPGFSRKSFRFAVREPGRPAPAGLFVSKSLLHCVPGCE